MGGIVYNILHTTPFAKYDRDGNIVEFIQTGQRSHYAGEGVFMSTLSVAGGTMLYSFNWLNIFRGYGQHKIASFTVIILQYLLLELYFLFIELSLECIIKYFSHLYIMFKILLYLIKEIHSKFPYINLN